MGRLPRKAYIYEFKMEAVRLVESGQSVAQAAHTLGVVEQTLSNRIQAHRAGKLSANGRGSKLTAEQIKIRQLRRAKAARLKMERDIQAPPNSARPFLYLNCPSDPCIQFNRVHASGIPRKTHILRAPNPVRHPSKIRFPVKSERSRWTTFTPP